MYGLLNILSLTFYNKSDMNLVTYIQERKILENQRIMFDRSITQRLLKPKHKHYWNELYPNKYQFTNKKYKKDFTKTIVL